MAFHGHEKAPPLGTGERFARLKASLAHRGDVRDPGAVAASIGRKKFGAKRFAALGRDGRARALRTAAARRMGRG